MTTLEAHSSLLVSITLDLFHWLKHVITSSSGSPCLLNRRYPSLPAHVFPFREYLFLYLSLATGSHIGTTKIDPNHASTAKTEEMGGGASMRVGEDLGMGMYRHPCGAIRGDVDSWTKIHGDYMPKVLGFP